MSSWYTSDSRSLQFEDKFCSSYRQIDFVEITGIFYNKWAKSSKNDINYHTSVLVHLASYVNPKSGVIT